MKDNFTTPHWVKDAVFYQIFPDRFAKSARVPKPGTLETWSSPPTIFGFKGGDLIGVVEHLDYLQDLGINAIYFNPIFQSASNHRYHTHDYYQVDPILGGTPAFRELLDKAHRRDIKIVLDGVFNHASRGFFQFNHLLECGESSPYVDWFLIDSYPITAYLGSPNYQCWYDLPALPEFNTDNPEVRSFLFSITRFWLEFGIDGWRLDVPMSIDDDEFWREFRNVVKSTNPDAYIVGEIPWEAHKWLAGDQFDGVTNYQFTQACLGFFAGERINWDAEKNLMGLPKTPVLDAQSFAKRVEDLLTMYPREATLAQLNLLDSHDMPRFITLASGDAASYQLATLFQMTYPGAPCIYYGDEIGMQGGESGYPEASRHSFEWDQNGWDTDLLNYVKECVALRKSHPALRHGEFLSLYANNMIYIYMLSFVNDLSVIVINASTKNYQLDVVIPPDISQNLTWSEHFTNKEATNKNGHLHGLNIPPRTGAFLTPDNVRPEN